MKNKFMDMVVNFFKSEQNKLGSSELIAALVIVANTAIALSAISSSEGEDVRTENTTSGAVDEICNTDDVETTH